MTGACAPLRAPFGKTIRCMTSRDEQLQDRFPSWPHRTEIRGPRNNGACGHRSTVLRTNDVGNPGFRRPNTSVLSGQRWYDQETASSCRLDCDLIPKVVTATSVRVVRAKLRGGQMSRPSFRCSREERRKPRCACCPPASPYYSTT